MGSFRAGRSRPDRGSRPLRGGAGSTGPGVLPRPGGRVDSRTLRACRSRRAGRDRRPRPSRGLDGTVLLGLPKRGTSRGRAVDRRTGDGEDVVVPRHYYRGRGDRQSQDLSVVHPPSSYPIGPVPRPPIPGRMPGRGSRSSDPSPADRPIPPHSGCAHPLPRQRGRGSGAPSPRERGEGRGAGSAMARNALRVHRSHPTRPPAFPNAGDRAGNARSGQDLAGCIVRGGSRRGRTGAPNAGGAVTRRGRSTPCARRRRACRRPRRP
ncbi:hypothetical protein ElP_10460 [Tautonia plasticadhaerens]|uniref:Uncharacterized protein n=1 Tax=Tautonia plasticadhaerens TaxID=2527974 RepID=A0A518GX81_9BACT|nr:hypothetical protein ElP_10460 [Tautonia plasticadhaerens]